PLFPSGAIYDCAVTAAPATRGHRVFGAAFPSRRERAAAKACPPGGAGGNRDVAATRLAGKRTRVAQRCSTGCFAFRRTRDTAHGSRPSSLVYASERKGCGQEHRDAVLETDCRRCNSKCGT